MKNRTDTYGYNCKNDIEIKNKQSMTIYIQFTNDNNNNINDNKLKNYINQTKENI